jgi:predicted nucleic acid-binding protein
MNRILVDTDVIIDTIRNENKAIVFLEKVEKNYSIAISEITNMELIVGCRNKNELSELKKFLKHFEIISLNELIGTKAKELLEKYYLSHHLLIPDALNASVSIILNIPFVSKNHKDYAFIKELNLLQYS